jgi:hypothetical protein
LAVAKREADAAEPPIQVPDSPSVTLALLRSARSEVKGQAIGSRAVHRSTQLAWKALIELYGDEGVLCERIANLKALNLEGNEELLQLADKYVGGWRPPTFGED